MSDVLTREEYVGVAKAMTFPANSWINGKFVSAKSGETYESLNPATGEVLAQVSYPWFDPNTFYTDREGIEFDRLDDTPRSLLGEPDHVE